MLSTTTHKQNKMQKTVFSDIFVPEINWFKPELADEDPAFHSDRILPNTTLGQCLPSFDVVDEVMAAVKTYFFSNKIENICNRNIVQKMATHGYKKIRNLIMDKNVYNWVVRHCLQILIVAFVN